MAAPGPADVTLPADIGTRTFTLVRKGFDTDEVRRHLAQVERLVAAAPAQAPASEVDAAAQAEAEAVLAAAHHEADALLDDARRRHAEAAVAPVDPEQQAHAAGIVAAAQAEADEMVRQAGTAPPPAAEDALGGHAARVLSLAEEEAAAMVAAARAEAAATTAPLEDEQARSLQVVTTAQAEALAVIGEAESRAAQLRADAEPRAREQVAQALAAAEGDLAAARTAQAEARSHLVAVQEQVGALLASYPAAVDGFLGTDPFRRPSDTEADAPPVTGGDEPGSVQAAAPTAEDPVADPS